MLTCAKYGLPGELAHFPKYPLRKYYFRLEYTHKQTTAAGFMLPGTIQIPERQTTTFVSVTCSPNHSNILSFLDPTYLLTKLYMCLVLYTLHLLYSSNLSLLPSSTSTGKNEDC